MSPAPSPAKAAPNASAASVAHNMMMVPRCTMSITRTKGLLNMPGQNNCFLNSAVQVLWHLDIFRRSFRELSGHICMAESCIFCALKELFAQFQYSQESALPPDALRRALAETFFDQRRFQLGFMDDAAECFENILQRIHFHIASQEVEDMCSVNHCIPHQKFAMTLVEQTVCHVCGASSEPLPFTQMVHYVSASALCLQASISHGKEQKPVSFGELLRRAGGMGDIRDCPSSCGAKIQICKTLMNSPDIVSLGLVWDSERPSVEHIIDVLDTIGMTINMNEMFHTVVDRWAASVTHHLVGIVTYYGKHYSTFFFHTKLCVWIYFDDATVREIGPHWQQVVDKCRRGHFQPLLLLYANPNGSPVCTANAPTTVIHYMTEHKRKQTEPKKVHHEKHHYGQQSVQNTESFHPCATSGGVGDSSQWTRGSSMHGKKAYKSINMGGRSAHDTRHNGMGPHLHSAQNQYPKPRIRTYSDTSIMSEHPSEPSCSNSSDVEFKRPSDTLRRLVRRGSTEAALEAELSNTYISRQAVESVLNLQRLQRQRSLNGVNGTVVPGSRNSSSSLESFENSLQMRDKSSDCPDGACRRRDSGNWSGDRNSASSASSTSLDGSYYYIAGAKRACGSPGRTVNNFSKHEYMNVGVFADQGYDSYSLSSTDSYPSVGLPGSPAKLDPRLKKIPEATQIPDSLESAIHNSLMQGSDSASDTVFDEDVTGSKYEGASGDCDKLCAQAELFLKKSYEKEQAGDLPLACFFCESAAAKARLAMDAPYSNTQSLVAAKMKHSTCIMRSSALCKRIKEAEMEERRRIKESSGHDVHHSRQGSRDSTHSRQSQKEGQHARQGSRDSSGGTIVECSDRPVKNIEIYATLPKKGSKKKSGALLSHMSVRLREDVEIYKDFLSKQWQNSSSKDDSARVMSDGEYPVNSRSKIRDGTSSLSKASTMRSKDSEFSDYSSEWEHARKPALHRTLSNPAGMKNRDEEDNANASGSSASAKKQHKIRRKLMGGFMRRKNRSLPDLRENKDAPQTESRALDDNIIFDSPGGVAPKPCHDDDADGREDHSATINSRGFHQPHRAFVNRALSQRPLLTKVDPPHVEVARSPSPIKFKHGPKVEHCDLYEPAGYAAALHQHSAVCTKRDKVAEQPRGSLSSNEFPPPPSPLPSQPDEEIETALEANCFLRELQIKRTQIMSTVPKATESARKPSSEAHGQGAFHPEIDQASAENSWLRELQSKQMSMLRRSDRPEDNGTTKEQALAALAQAFQQSLPRPASPVKTKVVLQADRANSASQTQAKPRQIPDVPPRQESEPEEVKPRSVKDLASRFEKILKPAMLDPERPIIPDDLAMKMSQDIQPPSGEHLSNPAASGSEPKESLHQSPNANLSSTSGIGRRDFPVTCLPSVDVELQTKCVPTSHFPQSSVPSSNINSLPRALHQPPFVSSYQQAAAPVVPVHSSHPQHPAMPLNYHNPAHQSPPFTNPSLCTPHHPPYHPSVSQQVAMQMAAHVQMHGVTTSYDQKPNFLAKCQHPQQQYGKAFQYVKSPDGTETRAFVAVRIPQAVQALQADHSRQAQLPPSDAVLRSVSPANSDSSKRPTRPPDYETALQRLEMMKERQRTASPDCPKLSAKSVPEGAHPQQPSQQQQQVPELNKKRKAALKKCVTFSDEVVLVACAEEEESDYLPNPLLERVYRQHAAKQDSKECQDLCQSEDLNSVHSSDSCDSAYQVDAVVDSDNNSQVPCNLCHKKSVSPPTVYCPDCAFYMSRFQKRT
ncbi:unnamed protein product [Ixodes pacificus]